MDEPQRLLDGSGSDLEQSLLHELRSYRGSEAMRAHTLAALGLTASAGLTAGGTLGWWAGKTFATKAIIAVSITSVLVSLPVGYFMLRDGRKTSPAPAPAPDAAPRRDPPPAPMPPNTSTAAPSSDSPANPSRALPSRSSPRAVEASADLRAEVAALDAVRAHLANGDLPLALSSLDTYSRGFPRGRLRLEAEILRIDALAKAGRSDEARAAAKDFLRRHPKNVHAARIEMIAGS